MTLWSPRTVVVPHAGTWIEISLTSIITGGWFVVPHAGTWIEIWRIVACERNLRVVPHAGTWIEITSAKRMATVRRSCLTQARGLK